MSIELYNLDLHHKEQNSVALSYPEIVEKISNIMIEAHYPSSILRFKFPQLGD